MGLQSTTEAILNAGLTNNKKKAFYEYSDNEGAIPIEVPVNSISFSNVGTANATIGTNGLNRTLPAGASISFDAGGGDNTFPENMFSYESTGTILLIAFTSNIL